MSAPIENKLMLNNDNDNVTEPGNNNLYLFIGIASSNILDITNANMKRML